MHADGINISDLRTNAEVDSLEKLKRERAIKNKAIAAMKEAVLAVLFALLAMLCAYQMLDNSSFGYQATLKNTFGAGTLSTSFLTVIYYSNHSFYILYLRNLGN